MLHSILLKHSQIVLYSIDNYKKYSRGLKMPKEVIKTPSQHNFKLFEKRVKNYGNKPENKPI